MKSLAWSAIALGLMLLFLADGGCRGSQDKDKVAELVAQQNAVMRDFSSGVGRWQRANQGDVFRIGDGLKTGNKAFARLRIVPEGEMLVQSDTLVRFQATAPGEKSRKIKVETGSVEIDSARAALQIRTEIGLARIERGSRMQLKASPNASELKVLVGSVELDQQGKRVSVAAGQALSLEVGGVVIDREAKKTSEVSKPVNELPALDAATPPEPTSEAETAPGLAEPGGTSADLSIVAGESATIHDPSPPTEVRIPLAGCESGGAVEVGRPGAGYKVATIRGRASAVVRLPAGRYSYRVRCVKPGKERAPVGAKGSLVIVRDAGLRQLPKKAADITVEADGRSYTVRYQNLLPRITFIWPDAPVSKAYTININSEGGKARAERLSQPRYTFSSGRLGEGRHQFYFAIPGGRRSPAGKLSIAFDNTALTASLSEPAEGTAASGQKVPVGGTALARSRVTVRGTEIATDAQGRFKTEVNLIPEESAIAVRVQHGAAKVHYYLRHLSINK